MVFAGRNSNSSTRRPWRSKGSVIVAGLVGLALLASLLLVFTESVQMLRIAVVVALWAAVVGAIAMTKYRRESALDKAKVDDLKTVYSLQLEREISARREYEASLEEKVRAELRIDADEMSALRADLAALRRNLELLIDGGVVEPGTALRSSSESVRELDGSPRVDAPAPSGPAFSSPDDEPLTAETITVSVSQDDRQERSDSPNQDSDAKAPEEESDEPDEEPTGRRARRRYAEDSSGGGQGRSVAEILASISSER